MIRYYRIQKIKELGQEITKYKARQKVDDQYRTACFDAHIVIIITDGYYSIATDVTYAFESSDSVFARGKFIDLAYYEIEAAKLVCCPKEGLYFGQISYNQLDCLSKH